MDIKDNNMENTFFIIIDFEGRYKHFAIKATKEKVLELILNYAENSNKPCCVVIKNKDSYYFYSFKGYHANDEPLKKELDHMHKEFASRDFPSCNETHHHFNGSYPDNDYFVRVKEIDGITVFSSFRYPGYEYLESFIYEHYTDLDIVSDLLYLFTNIKKVKSELGSLLETESETKKFFEKLENLLRRI
jgi:hypothetical protein